MNLYQRFEETSFKFEKKKAVFFKKEKLTYKQLRRKIQTLACGLRHFLHLQKGAKVAILLENSDDYIISLFALFGLGVTAVPLNIFLKSEELEYILSDCRPDFLFTSTKFLPVLNSLNNLKGKIILTDTRRENFLYLKDFFKKPEISFSCAQTTEEDTAIICYTSSTTGKPKGVMLTHKNFISDVEGCCEVVRVDYKDRFLLLLPMFHSYTLTACVFAPLLSGAGVYIFSSFKNLSSVVSVIIFKRITILVGIPRIFKMFSKVKIPKFLLMFCPLRFALSGASALEPEIIEKFKKNLGLTLIQGYGLTEASPVVCLNPLDRQKLGSIGLPLPNCEVKVVDDSEREVSLNTAGELIVKGPMVMKGYLNLPEETAKAIKGEWLFTGDIAKIDEDGYVYILDRKKDLIITHGMNIYPKEVEDAIEKHEAVKEAAVIGKRDEKRGEIPVAIIVLEEGKKIEPDGIKSFLKGKLADYKIPHIIEFREKLPKTPTGKILKRILRNEINQNL